LELFTIMVLAVALGTDSFSVCLGIGTTGVRTNNIFRISIIIGVFHVVMPLIGLILGDLMGKLAGNIAGSVGAIILILLGGKIIWENLRGDGNEPSINYNSLGGILILAFSVSLDALSIGFSLGALGTPLSLAIVVFGAVAFLMSGLGLMLGRQLNTIIGQRAEIGGGIILIALGVFALLGS